MEQSEGTVYTTNENAADLIIKGSAIYDSIHEQPFEGFVAVKGNRIQAVERSRNVLHYCGPSTQVYEADDRLVMAGFHDSHTHLLMAGMYQICPNLANARSEEEAAAMLNQAYSHSALEYEWVIGFGWYHVFWDNDQLPSRHTLDQYFPEKPVFLLNAEAHGAWVNSKALQIAGITRRTPDPYGGEIQRDSEGEPTGFLSESAVGLATRYAFSFTPAQQESMIRCYLDSARKYGITSVIDVQPYFHGNMGDLHLYHTLDQQGRLTVRVHVALDLLGDLDEAVSWRDKVKSDKLRVDHLKQFLDGVISTRTALVLEAYQNHPASFGTSLMDTEAIRQAVSVAHSKGFSVKLHACGDQATKLGLDYIEEAIKTYGKNSCRHAIEHLEMVADEDIPRFGTLSVLPSVQPEHMALTQSFSDNPYPKVLGKKRADKTWPLKDLYDTAGILAIGSDCPVVDNNPFPEIYRAVTRRYNDGEPPEGWNPAQKLTMHQVLRSYTYGSAYGAGREKDLGTLEKDKLADIIVIDQNLFTVDPYKIMGSQVDLTVMDGRIIHDTTL